MLTETLTLTLIVNAPIFFRISAGLHGRRAREGDRAGTHHGEGPGDETPRLPASHAHDQSQPQLRLQQPRAQ